MTIHIILFALATLYMPYQYEVPMQIETKFYHGIKLSDEVSIYAETTIDNILDARFFHIYSDSYLEQPIKHTTEMVAELDTNNMFLQLRINPKEKIIKLSAGLGFK